MTTKKAKYFIFIMLPLLGGCIGLEHLQENQKLLYRQGIQAPKEVDVEKLHDLYAQKANRKILGLPISPLVSIYYFGARRYNKEKFIKQRDAVIEKFDEKIANTSSQKKINTYQFKKQKKVTRLNKIIDEGNLWMQWGEPVAIYDTALTQITKRRFHDYLFSKGYFTNKVTFKDVEIGRLVSLVYKIEPGRPYILDSILYQLKDTVIFKIIKSNIKASHLKIGERYQENNLTNERERIDLLLKDNGYYDFSRQYMDFNVDTTTLGNRKVMIVLNMKDPAKRGYHKQFKVDSVFFVTDAGLKPSPRLKRNTINYRGINFSSFLNNYNLKILRQRVFISPNDLYNRSNTINTQRQLSNLDAFKFVNINYDTSKNKFLANIATSPQDRYQWSNEAGVNVTQGYPGPFDYVTFKKRNVFKGLETFELTGRFGFEGVASASKEKNVYRSTETGINAALTFPTFLWPFKEDTELKLGQYNPKTKISSGYSYTDRPEYRRSIISLNYNYSWESGRSRRFDFTPASLNIINSVIRDNVFDARLDTLLKQGNNLKRSFNPSFVSSIIFGMTWNDNSYGNKEKTSTYLRWQIESGGTLQNIFNYSFIEKYGLQSYRYLRLNLDFRKNIVLNKNTTLAYRINSGMAYSFDSLRVLPYEKYFFAGGSNGVRAWRPRRLGEGSLKPTQSSTPRSDGLYNYSFEKPGDVLIEGSVELRKHIVGFIEGAVFVDVGNVWYLFPQKNTANQNNGNAQFKSDSFFKQFGVGTGFGLRFDFSFLLIRLDVGMKVFDPAQDRFVLDKVKFWRPYASQNDDGTFFNYKEPVIYNFGIGYPF